MDSFLDFAFLLSGNEGSETSHESFDIPVDAERAGVSNSYSMCVIS